MNTDDLKDQLLGHQAIDLNRFLLERIEELKAENFELKRKLQEYENDSNALDDY